MLKSLVSTVQKTQRIFITKKNNLSPIEIMAFVPVVQKTTTLHGVSKLKVLLTLQLVVHIDTTLL
jgi:hypothetical protein